MKYELWAVEVETSSNPLTYGLVRRCDESGTGSPLTWPARSGAEEYIESIRREVADPDWDGAEAVCLTGETGSENEPAAPRVLSHRAGW